MSFYLLHDCTKPFLCHSDDDVILKSKIRPDKIKCLYYSKGNITCTIMKICAKIKAFIISVVTRKSNELSSLNKLR